MTNNKLVSGLLLAVAVAFLFVVQFTPWATFSESGNMMGMSFDMEMSAGTWSATAGANGFSDSTSYYDSDMSDESGVGLMRAGAPILLVGMVGLLVGMIGVFTRQSWGGIAGMIGAGLTTVAMVLIPIGVAKLFDGVSQTWHVAFYFAILATVCAIVGSILALTTPTTKQLVEGETA